MVDPLVQEKKCVGIEITRTALHAVFLSASGEIDAARSTRLVSDGNPVAELVEFIDGLKKEFGDFSNCGIAVPGLVDRSTGRVAFSANIPEHTDIDLLNEVRAATGLTVVIENDANAAAYGEFSVGAGRGSRNIFFATLGEGVGGAFIFGGDIWRGAAGYAGEFGYVPINSEGTRLEDVASAANIIRRTRSRFHSDSTSSLSRMPEEAITLSDIIAAAEQEDDFAEMMLERTGIYVGTAIATVINLLNIERVVVGGEIMEARHLVLDAIIERARELSFEPSFESTTIIEGELGINAAAVGAALICAKV